MTTTIHQIGWSRDARQFRGLSRRARPGRPVQLAGQAAGGGVVGAESFSLAQTPRAAAAWRERKVGLRLPGRRGHPHGGAR